MNFPNNRLSPAYNSWLDYTMNAGKKTPARLVRPMAGHDADTAVPHGKLWPKLPHIYCYSKQNAL
jgi:hypothetical protein